MILSPQQDLKCLCDVKKKHPQTVSAAAGQRGDRSAHRQNRKRKEFDGQQHAGKSGVRPNDGIPVCHTTHTAGRGSPFPWQHDSEGGSSLTESLIAVVVTYNASK